MLKFLGFLVVMAAVVFGVGLLLDWWSVSTDEGARGDRITVETNDDKLEEDLGNVGEKVRDIGSDAKEEVKHLAKDEVAGTIASLDLESGTLAVRTTDGDVRTLVLAEEVEVTVDGEPGTLAALRPGDRAEVWHEDRDGEAHVVAIAVDRTG